MEILCENDTCPVYYARGKALRDVQEAVTKLDEVKDALQSLSIHGLKERRTGTS
jgi:hypothetical protein